MTTPRILVLDDDAAYCEQITTYLGMQGFQVSALQDPARFDDEFRRFGPDLVLLDQRLGDQRGTEVLMRLRKRSSVPCIIVTGTSEALDRIVNLEVGADDEIDKSTPRELLARIRAVLRRSTPTGPLNPSVALRDRRQGGWILSANRRDLLRPDGTACGLTSSEFETLSLLWDCLGQPVSRARISDEVFKRTFRQGDRAVDTVVMKLRLKIGGEVGQQAINAVRLAGYVFTGFTAEAEA